MKISLLTILIVNTLFGCRPSLEKLEFISDENILVLENRKFKFSLIRLTNSEGKEIYTEPLNENNKLKLNEYFNKDTLGNNVVLELYANHISSYEVSFKIPSTELKKGQDLIINSTTQPFP